MNEVQIYQPRASPEEAQRARLCLSSSVAAALAESGAPAEELAAALGSDERAALPVALAAILGTLATVDPQDPDAEAKDLALGAECMQAIVNMKPEMDEDKRVDWVGSVMRDFDAEPYELVLEAVRLVRRSCRYPGDFVPNVIAHVLSRKVRLEAERARLEQLSEAIA